ncbi:MAG: phage tail protein [Sphingomonadales bacterium]|nr:phage tail protein [Sphingomonadales bacterium]
MAVTLPNGALIHIGSAYGSALTVSAVTNANPAVPTPTAHGLANGAYVLPTPGWTRPNRRTFRVANIATNTFELEGIDTSNTNVYAAGSGIGSAKKVTTWTQIQQVLTTASSGGEQQFTDYQFLEADSAVRIPTFKSPVQLTISVADDPSLPGYIACKAANDDRAPRAVRISLPNSAKLAYNGYVSIASTPSLTVNQVMALEATVTLVNPEPSRYAT